MQDSIQREISIDASRESVYNAIADPQQVTEWFPESLEGAYRVGEQPIFGFGEHGRNQIYVVAAEPHSYFAFRWVPGANQFIGDVRKVPNTLVEFRLEELPGGSCMVKLTESGFATLPAEMMSDAFNQNSNGWDFMLGRLQHRFATDT